MSGSSQQRSFGVVLEKHFPYTYKHIARVRLPKRGRTKISSLLPPTELVGKCLNPFQIRQGSML
jgi:hypothetical protein